jgi:hypothetical protein
MYVEELIGADTINTMPVETLAAFRDHGRARASLEADLKTRRQTLAELEAVGISLLEVTTTSSTRASRSSRSRSTSCWRRWRFADWSLSSARERRREG